MSYNQADRQHHPSGQTAEGSLAGPLGVADDSGAIERIVSLVLHANFQASVPNGAIQVDTPGFPAKYRGFIREYASYLNEPCLKSALNVLQTSESLIGNHKVMKQCTKNLLKHLHNDSKAYLCLRIKSDGHKAALFRLNALVKSYLETNDTEMAVFTINAASMINLSYFDYDSAIASMDLAAPRKRNSTFYIYSYLKGICEVYRGNVPLGYSFLWNASHCSGILHSAIPVLLVVAACSNRMWLRNREYFARLLLKLPHASESVDDATDYNKNMAVGDRCSRPACANLIVEYCDNMLLGKAERVEKLHESLREYFIRQNLLEFVSKHGEMMCFCNSLYRRWLNEDCPATMDLSDVYVNSGSPGYENRQGNSQSAVYESILRCIDLRIINGNLSLKRNVLVLSKSDPFPEIGRILPKPPMQ